MKLTPNSIIISLSQFNSSAQLSCCFVLNSKRSSYFYYFFKLYVITSGSLSDFVHDVLFQVPSKQKAQPSLPSPGSQAQHPTQELSPKANPQAKHSGNCFWRDLRHGDVALGDVVYGPQGSAGL